MQFDPAGLYGGAAPLQFRLEASSASQEVDSRDNTAGLDLQLDTEADLELVGSPGPVTLTWRAGGQVVLNNFTQTFQVGPAFSQYLPPRRPPGSTMYRTHSWKETDKHRLAVGNSTGQSSCRETDLTAGCRGT